MGKLVEIKTKASDASVEAFLDGITDAKKRDDSRIIVHLMRKATGEEPKMWGTSIIGFGNMRYKSPATGREVDWFMIGFSPRKANLSLHLLHLDEAALVGLGKHKTGKGCLYINKLADVDLKALEAVIKASIKR